MNRFFIVLAGVPLCACILAAQTQEQPRADSDRRASTTIQSKSQEVLLDMVVRDHKGKTIRDIRPDEIHVFENGVEQKMTSFHLVQGQTDVSSSTEAQAAPSLDPMREVRLVTLVFEGLDQEGKRFFLQALKDMLAVTPQQNLYFSVMVVDQTLHCIQPFTADHQALLKSVQKAATWTFVQYQSNSQAVTSELQQKLSGGEPQLEGGAGGGPSPSQVQSFVDWNMAKMQYDMLKEAAAADRQYDAHGTLNALGTLVRAESELPGRKVVLYFNPKLIIPEMLKEQYRDLISAANRANVSFYTVDPKGLVALGDAGQSSARVTERPNGPMTYSGGEGKNDLNGATGEIRSQQLSGGVGTVSTSQARAMDNASEALREDPMLWLADLARETGGTAIANTNDWRAPFRTIMDEVETYYEASYSPQIAVYDGSFRKISVRVDHPGATVQTRSGYFALPQLKSGQQLSAFEMPLLNALNSATPLQQISFHAAAERFDDHGSKVEYMLTVETPLKEITFTPQPDHTSAAVNASLLAVIKNPGGEIVEKFSKNFAVQVALDKVDAYQMGDLVQTFRTELAPGSYTLEAVVMDRNGNKTGVKKSAVVVPQPSDRLSMSDVVVVRRTEPIKDTQMLDAFYFPGGKVVPSLSDTLKGGPGNILPFYFSIYPNPAIKDAPELTMAFYKDGQYLGAAQAPLPKVEPDGRIPYIANLPADKFTPGPYEIRVGVTQGASKVEEKVDFQVD